MESAEVFRTLKKSLAYASFESSDIAGAVYKLIDALDNDISVVYTPNETVALATLQVEENIEAWLGQEEEDNVEVEEAKKSQIAEEIEEEEYEEEEGINSTDEDEDEDADWSEEEPPAST